MKLAEFNDEMKSKNVEVDFDNSYIVDCINIMNKLSNSIKLYFTRQKRGNEKQSLSMLFVTSYHLPFISLSKYIKILSKFS